VIPVPSRAARAFPPGAGTKLKIIDYSNGYKVLTTRLIARPPTTV
jgi:hypothetical protein